MSNVIFWFIHLSFFTFLNKQAWSLPHTLWVRLISWVMSLYFTKFQERSSRQRYRWLMPHSCEPAQQTQLAVKILLKWYVDFSPVWMILTVFPSLSSTGKNHIIRAISRDWRAMCWNIFQVREMMEEKSERDLCTAVDFWFTTDCWLATNQGPGYRSRFRF